MEIGHRRTAQGRAESSAGKASAYGYGAMKSSSCRRRAIRGSPMPRGGTPAICAGSGKRRPTDNSNVPIIPLVCPRAIRGWENAPSCVVGYAHHTRGFRSGPVISNRPKADEPFLDRFVVQQEKGRLDQSEASWCSRFSKSSSRRSLADSGQCKGLPSRRERDPPSPGHRGENRSGIECEGVSRRGRYMSPKFIGWFCTTCANHHPRRTVGRQLG